MIRRLLVATVLALSVPYIAAAQTGEAETTLRHELYFELLGNGGLDSINYEAQTAGSSDADAIRQRVREGQKVRVTDDQGREWQGRIEALAPDNLVLLTKDRQRRDVPYAAILRIDRPNDTLANGARIGFASGAAFGMLAVIAEAKPTATRQHSSVAAIPPRPRTSSFRRLSAAQGPGSVWRSMRWSGGTRRCSGVAIRG